MARKKGRLKLLDALNLLEATTAKNYPDNGTGIAGDDDRPPGNIVYGEKYKKVPYFNRLTDFQERWGVDLSDWKWDEFEHSMGMEDLDNYSNTLQSMKDLFPKQTWENMMKRFKNVPDSLATLRFKQAGQPYRKGGKDQVGSDKETHVDVDMNKDGEFKDAEIKNEELLSKIDDFTL